MAKATPKFKRVHSAEFVQNCSHIPRYRRRDALDCRRSVARPVAHIRRRWPHVRILLPRGDLGFARETLMAWCEDNGVDYLFGWAQNDRLVATITTGLPSPQPRA